MRLLEDPEQAVAWLDAKLRDGDSGHPGYAVEGWEAAVWILHTIYENPTLPGGMSHDDVHRAGVASGEEAALDLPGLDMEGVDVWTTGGGLGRAGWPGLGWVRLRWSELAERNGIDLLAKYYPTADQFGYRSWPANIIPPTEGSADREQFHRIVEFLAGESAQGDATLCHAYYTPLTNYDQTVRVFELPVSELNELYEDDEVTGSPTNLWSVDRSWMVYSDWDLNATRVSGSRDLIAALESDSGLETREVTERG